MSAAEVIAEIVESLRVETADRGSYESDAAALIQALKAARYAVVELPEQMEDRSNVPELLRPQPMWELDDSWTCLTAPDCIDFEAAHQTEYGTVTVTEARSLAAALLAAVNAAEAAEAEPTTETSAAIPPAADDDPAGCIPPQSAGSPHLK